VALGITNGCAFLVNPVQALSFVHVMFGRGFPVALHNNITFSPFLETIVWFLFKISGFFSPFKFKPRIFISLNQVHKNESLISVNAYTLIPDIFEIVDCRQRTTDGGPFGRGVKSKRIFTE
jgi:hypothetical protein